MSRLERLRKGALAACEYQGHKMKRFEHSIPYNGIMRGHIYSECKICGKGVMCNSNPAPNEIDIGGEAVALGCED